MSLLSTFRSASNALLVWCILCVGCGDPVVVGNNPNRNTNSGPIAPTGEPDIIKPEALPELFKDEDFVDADMINRDPFRNYAHAFRRKITEPPQREVLMPTLTVDEMKLIAIVSAGARSRAMFQDPTGVGHVVKRGDYVGREEVVQTGGVDGLPVRLNWRVSRIQAGERAKNSVQRGEVILERQDPTAPDAAPVTRKITLEEPGE